MASFFSFLGPVFPCGSLLSSFLMLKCHYFTVLSWSSNSPCVKLWTMSKSQFLQKKRHQFSHYIFFFSSQKFHVLRNVFGKFEKWKCDFFLETKVNCNVQLYCTYGKKNFKDFYTLIPRITAIFFGTNCAKLGGYIEEITIQREFKLKMSCHTVGYICHKNHVVKTLNLFTVHQISLQIIILSWTGYLSKCYLDSNTF